MKLVIKSVLVSILLTLSIYAQPVNQYVIKRNGTAVIDTLYTTKHITDTAVVSDIQINGSLRANDFQIKNRLTEAVKFSIDTNGTVSGNNLIILGNATLGGSMATINDNPGGSMYGYSLNGKNLSGANYIGSVFNDESDPPAGMDLMSVDMSRALAMGAVFKKCSFDENSSIQSMNATGADFDSVDFGNCDMEYLIATNSKLTNSILSTKITGMNVIGADLTGATVPYTLSEFQSITVWDKTTKWTDGNFMQGTVLQADTIIGAVGRFDEVDAEEVVENDTSLADKYLSKNGGTINGNLVVTGTVQAETIVGTVVGDMAWQPPATGAIFNGVDGWYVLSASSNNIFGTGDFTYEAYIRLDTPAVSNGIIGGEIGSPRLYYSNTQNQLYTENGATGPNSNTLTAYPMANTWRLVHYVRSAGVGTFYVDGNAVGGAADVNNYTVPPTYIGAYAASFPFHGIIQNVKLYNRALTQAEVTTRWNNGAPWLAELPYADRGANNTNLTASNDFTSGWTVAGTGLTVGATTLTATQTSGVYKSILQHGKRYRITATITNTVKVHFRNLSNLTGRISVEPGTTQAVSLDYTHYGGSFYIQMDDAGEATIENLTITPIGCTYETAGFGTNTVYDGSGNENHGTVSGGVISLDKGSKAEYRDGAQARASDWAPAGIVPAGYILKRIIFHNTSENSCTINVGSSTSGGTDVVNGAVVAGGTIVTVEVNKLFSFTAAQNLYFQSAGWQATNIRLIMEKQ